MSAALKRTQTAPSARARTRTSQRRPVRSIGINCDFDVRGHEERLTIEQLVGQIFGVPYVKFPFEMPSSVVPEVLKP